MGIVARPAPERLLLQAGGARSRDDPAIRLGHPRGSTGSRGLSYGWAGPTLGTAVLCLGLGVVPGLVTALAHAVLYVFVLAPLINRTRTLAGYTELQRQHGVQHAAARLGDGRGEPAQQSPRTPAIAEVQCASDRGRPLVAGDPGAGRPRAHRDQRNAGRVFSRSASFLTSTPRPPRRRRQEPGRPVCAPRGTRHGSPQICSER